MSGLTSPLSIFLENFLMPIRIGTVKPKGLSHQKNDMIPFKLAKARVTTSISVIASLVTRRVTHCVINHVVWKIVIDFDKKSPFALSSISSWVMFISKFGSFNRSSSISGVRMVLGSSCLAFKISARGLSDSLSSVVKACSTRTMPPIAMRWPWVLVQAVWAFSGVEYDHEIWLDITGTFWALFPSDGTLHWGQNTFPGPLCFHSLWKFLSVEFCEF